MKILVLIKQVPGTTQVDIDPVTGTLLRGGAESKMNPYDLYALETALRLKEPLHVEVVALTMGPPQAEAVLREAYMMGADQAYLVTDRHFAGADVLATSYTLARAARHIGATELILCGRQTTDGDTAQVGPAVAEHLGLPHVAWVTAIEAADAAGLTLRRETEDAVVRARLPFPCLITVEKNIHQPRLLSYLLKKKTRDWPIIHLDRDALRGDASRYGLDGSPTKVDAVYTPPTGIDREIWRGESTALAQRLYAHLITHRFIENAPKASQRQEE